MPWSPALTSVYRPPPHVEFSADFSACYPGPSSRHTGLAGSSNERLSHPGINRVFTARRLITKDRRRSRAAATSAGWPASPGALTQTTVRSVKNHSSKWLSRRKAGPALISAAVASLIGAACSAGSPAASVSTTRPSPTTASSGPTTTVSAADAASLAKGRALAAKVIRAPFGYVDATTKGLSGAITPEVFSSYGGATGADQAAFVAGFKQTYVTDPRASLVDPSVSEGIAVTLIEFSSPTAATNYFKEVERTTLSYAKPSYSTFAKLPGATRIDGTQAYNGGWFHAVEWVKGSTYALLAYANVVKSPAPLELTAWVLQQDSHL